MALTPEEIKLLNDIKDDVASAREDVASVRRAISGEPENGTPGIKDRLANVEKKVEEHDKNLLSTKAVKKFAWGVAALLVGFFADVIHNIYQFFHNL